MVGSILQVTGELTAGALSIIGTLVTLFGAWWIKNDRQTMRFSITIENMQRDILENRTNVTREIGDLKADMKSQNQSLDEIKLQLAALTAQHSMAHMMERLPRDLTRIMDAKRDEYQRRNNE